MTLLRGQGFQMPLQAGIIKRAIPVPKDEDGALTYLSIIARSSYTMKDYG